MICKLQSKGYTQKTTQVYFGVQLQLTQHCKSPKLQHKIKFN